MQAIILAAGVGQRLGDSAGNQPKCLLEFDGTSLLKRHLYTLKHYGISNILVVSGYQADLIGLEIEQSGINPLVNTAYNPDYTKGSLISLLIGLEALKINGDFILMDADVLYDQRIIECLVNTEINNCFLLDRNFVPGDEPVKLCVYKNRLVDFRKQIDKDLLFDYQGESVGFFRFSAETANKLQKHTQSYLERGKEDAPYEEIIRDLLLEQPNYFGFEDITGLKWIEIDFPEDVDRARNDILPSIEQVNI